MVRTRDGVKGHSSLNALSFDVGSAGLLGNIVVAGSIWRISLELRF